MLCHNYGVKEPCFGVPISELKKFQQRLKKDYQLALDLYDTGNYDAMYQAGLIADDARMTKRDLQRWVDKAYAGALPGATKPAHPLVLSRSSKPQEQRDSGMSRASSGNRLLAHRPMRL